MSRGFTLIELLVAMTLLALIAAVLFGGLRLGGSAATRIEARAEKLEDLRLVQSFLRQHLTSARPLVRIVDRVPVVAFDGRPDGVDFVGELPAHLAAGGRQAVRLRAGPGGALSLTWRPLGGDGAFDFGGGRRHRLATGLPELRFDYYGRRPADSEPRWHDTWRGADRLPDLVRVRTAADPAAWPALVVAPRLDPGLR